jgi:hypothetical protein
LVSFKYLMNQFTHFLFVWLFSARLIWGQALTISEVMFNPVGADDYDEYIEIVNINSSAVDLKDTYLLINGELENLQFHPGDSILSSGQYALILDRGYLIDGKSSTYDLLIPEDALLLTIDNSAFGKGGLLNTTKNEILLVSANDDTLSRVFSTVPILKIIGAIARLLMERRELETVFHPVIPISRSLICDATQMPARFPESRCNFG